MSIPRRVVPLFAALLTALLILSGVAGAEPARQVPTAADVAKAREIPDFISARSQVAATPAPTIVGTVRRAVGRYLLSLQTETADEEDADVTVDPEDEPEAAPVSTGRSIRGAEGARLIALNMALNGTPRDETARYLSQNFDLDDQDALLDEVYARVGD